ncbi:hypothetical protein HDU86_003469 [Geranomyces michiganensis]|nr:hypothetical protein HDU86_003469 [Geranomyces michiganensis]
MMRALNQPLSKQSPNNMPKRHYPENQWSALYDQIRQDSFCPTTFARNDKFQTETSCKARINDILAGLATFFKRHEQDVVDRAINHHYEEDVEWVQFWCAKRNTAFSAARAEKRTRLEDAVEYGSGPRHGILVRNPGEIEVIQRLLSLVSESSALSASSIGILTPYLGQRNAIARANIPADSLVSTVDGYQGFERDRILISGVRSGEWDPDTNKLAGGIGFVLQGLVDDAPG